jgi:hypothetical protein
MTFQRGIGIAALAAKRRLDADGRGLGAIGPRKREA